MTGSKVRILYCIEAMVHGGTEKQLAALIRGLDRSHFAPTLCTLKPSSMSLGELDCPAIELGFRTFRSAATFGCLKRLRTFIAHHRVEVIQTFFQDPTLVGLLGSLGTGVRVRVATFRDMGFWRTPGKVAQLRLAYPRFDGFIANSHAVAGRVHDLDGIPLSKIEVIPNGVVMPPRPAPAKSSGGLTVGIVANLDRAVKRVDLFLKAASIVRQRISPVRFVVVGDGHLRPELERDAERLGIHDCTSFLGGIKDVAAAISQFDVGVLTSDSEGLSNAILEYMAAAIPTVARNVGGNAEAVVPDQTGILVNTDDPEAIAGEIVSLLADDQRRRSMGETARDLAERRFSLGACIAHHEEYYHRLVRGSSVERTAVVLEGELR